MDSNNNMSAENLDRVPNHHLVHALNACFFHLRIAVHVKAPSRSHSLANNMAQIAQLEHKCLNIPGTSV